jgi:Ferritin-like domain
MGAALAGGSVAAHPTRRVMLAAAAILPLAAVSGCGRVDVLAAPPPPAPDVTVLREAIAAEQLLITWYTAVLRDARNAGGSPAALTAVLEPLLAEHRAHLSQLKSRLVVPAGSAASPSPTRRAATPTVPGAGSAGVAFLRDAEQAAAAAMLDRLRSAPGSLAQLYASISASEATHVPVLDAAAARTTSQVTG